MKYELFDFKYNPKNVSGRKISALYKKKLNDDYNNYCDPIDCEPGEQCERP